MRDKKHNEQRLEEFRRGLLDEMREQNKKDTEEIVKRVIGTAQVPTGYTKCAKCGRLIPLDCDTCPYCQVEPEVEPTPEPEEDASGGIISLLEGEDE